MTPWFPFGLPWFGAPARPCSCPPYYLHRSARDDASVASKANLVNLYHKLLHGSKYA